MRTFNLRNISTGLTIALCMLITVPTMAEPQRRDGGRTEQRSNSSRRPSTNNQRNDNNTKRNNSKVNNDNKKQQSGYSGNQRPNQQKPSTQKPSQGNQRPGTQQKPSAQKPYQSNQRPGAQQKPNIQHKPAQQHKPQPARPQPRRHVAPPARPYRPHYRPMPHVVVPHNWHPYGGAPVIRGILGLTFGTLYNATLDYLYSQNYVVDGYTDNIVYLRDVMQYNYMWDDVMLNYNYGQLASAQFVYSTEYNNTSRYNNVYRTLCNTYGSPISIGSGGYECAWYGGNSEGIVSLEYYHQGGRYYTTLSFGEN